MVEDQDALSKTFGDAGAKEISGKVDLDQQFVVCYLLFGGPQETGALREQLDRRGLCASPDAFSKVMSRRSISTSCAR